MPNINFKEKSFYKYIGDLSQVAGVKHFEFKSGRAKGVGAYEVRTGNGLNYTVLIDRSLDIAWAEFRGISFSFISNTGVVAPAYYEPEDINYFRTWTLGLLSTCGLTHVGSPCEDNGEKLGLHGRIGNLPAEEVGVEVDWESKDPHINISGIVRQASFYGENLLLKRKITSPLGENKIIINDQITNKGFQRQPFMILYHFNFGYPLLQENSEIIAPILKVTPQDERAKEGISTYKVIEPPQNGFAQQVYYWDLGATCDGWTFIGLVNEDLGFGVYQKYKKEALPRFIQWKQMGDGNYVMGLEPGNCVPEGRVKEHERGTLQYINAGETRIFELEVGILDGQEAINKFRDQVKSIC